jgi:hypothetical protein
MTRRFSQLVLASPSRWRVDAPMSAVPQKIGTRLVELRTPVGSVYVTPSFWQRLYLSWIFRNFHTLPKQVLNRRQQHLIDKLCRAGIVSRKRPLGTTVIGAVENVTIADCKLETATATQPVQRNVASEIPVSIASRNLEGAPTANAVITTRIDLKPVLPRGKVQNTVARETVKPVVKPVVADWNPRRLGSGARLAVVSASAGLLIGGFLYFRENRLGHSMSIPKVEAHESVSPAMTAPAAVQPQAEPQSTRARNEPTTNPDSRSTTPIQVKHEGSGQVERAGLRQPVSIDEPRPERLQVAEAPENGFGYPVTPDPNLSGKVDLRAVIGSDGAVKAIDVLSGNRVLAAAAARAVRHWRYRPPELNGHSVEAETNIVISFAGDDAVSVRFPTTQ